MQLATRYTTLVSIFVLITLASCEEKDAEPETVPPSVTTATATNISLHSADVEAVVNNEGSSAITTRGVCYSKEMLPTLDDFIIASGSGTGVFQVEIILLQSNTTYYVRAYAINETDTAFGNEVSFTTLEDTGGCVSTDDVVYDYDCNAYDVIQIGDQYWLQQNLKTTHYRNGVEIPTGLSDDKWTTTDKGAYAIYDDMNANDDVYGKLYNWFAVANENGLCPAGWHIPTYTEVLNLELFLGGADAAGGKMKTVLLWIEPNEGADNSSGFSALPGGQRFFSSGVYGSQGTNAIFWTSSTSANGGGKLGFYYVLSHLNSRLERPYLDKHGGYSCRCIKD